MAKAELKVEQKQIVTYEYVDSVTLKLTVEEANLVHDMLHMAGGSPTNSRREIADSVKDALRQAGVTGGPSDQYTYPLDIESGSAIYFKEQE
jgi:hypothetical protein